MPITSRAALATTLGLAAVAGLLISTRAQGQGSDEAVRKTNSSQSAAVQKVVSPAIIGTIDMDQVLKGYDKARAMDEKLKAEVLVEQEKLSKLMEEAKSASDQIQRLKQGTPDFQTLADKLTDLKVRLEAGKETAQAKMEQRVSESMTVILEDIRKVTSGVAKKYNMTYVVRISKVPPGGADQRSVAMSMGEPVVYSDPNADISEEVVKYLNHYYKVGGGTAPTATTAVGQAPKAAATGAATEPKTAAGNPATKTK